MTNGPIKNEQKNLIGISYNIFECPKAYERMLSVISYQEIQIKITVRYHFISTRKAKKKKRVPSFGGDVK